MKIRKSIVIAIAALSATSFIPPGIAEAHGRHHGGHYGDYHGYDHHHRHDFDRGARVAAGIVVGAAIAGAVANSVEADRDYRVSGSQRRSDHVSWCRAHYASYDAGTDTYVAPTGRAVACNSPYD